MFEDLRHAFREAVQNFRDELNRDEASGTMDDILRGMVREVTDTQARLKGVEADLEKARALVAHEEEQVATMARRQKMAREIDDAETARVAGEYLDRHRSRLEVFTQKADALEKEARLLTAEVREMTEQVKEARSRRAGLTAEAGRTGARESLGESQELFDAFERMKSRIEDDEIEADSDADFAREFGASDLRIDLDAPPPSSEVDFDAALEELKRRMGKSGGTSGD